MSENVFSRYVFEYLPLWGRPNTFPKSVLKRISLPSLWGQDADSSEGPHQGEGFILTFLLNPRSKLYIAVTKALRGRSKLSFCYGPFLEQDTGVEPAFTAWEAVVLPIYESCICEGIIAEGCGKSNHFLSKRDWGNCVFYKNFEVRRKGLGAKYLTDGEIFVRCGWVPTQPANVHRTFAFRWFESPEESKKQIPEWVSAFLVRRKGLETLRIRSV